MAAQLLQNTIGLLGFVASDHNSGAGQWCAQLILPLTDLFALKM
jgi:hypothetical protein